MFDLVEISIVHKSDRYCEQDYDSFNHIDLYYMNLFIDMLSNINY